jgi:hypothetical protein
LERGWFGAANSAADDAGHAYGAHARFWVEPERREEFAAASEARRAAWAWRRYVSAARAAATVEVRYESLRDSAREIADELGCLEERVADALSAFRPDSIGRWRDELSSDQLADVEAEAGDLLAELGYTLSR